MNARFWTVPVALILFGLAWFGAYVLWQTVEDVCFVEDCDAYAEEPGNTLPVVGMLGIVVSFVLALGVGWQAPLLWRDARRNHSGDEKEVEG